MKYTESAVNTAPPQYPTQSRAAAGHLRGRNK